MQRTQLYRRISRLRRGTTLVETALVLPVFLAFVLGLVELGHAYMVTNVMRAACRVAARLGSVSGTASAQVKQKALDVPGGSTIASMYQQMLDAFSKIAAKVPPAQLIYDTQ